MSPRLRASLSIFGVGLAMVMVALVAGGQGATPPPLDPASTRPDGTKGLVLLLQALGAGVEVGALPASAAPEAGSVALLLEDRLDTAGRDRLRSWVTAGGTLVVTDP